MWVACAAEARCFGTAGVAVVVVGCEVCIHVADVIMPVAGGLATLGACGALLLALAMPIPPRTNPPTRAAVIAATILVFFTVSLS